MPWQTRLGAEQIASALSTPVTNCQLLTLEVPLLRRGTNPSYPSSPIISKRQLPRWFKGLKILIRLEKGPNRQSIDEPQRNQESKDLSGVEARAGLGAASVRVGGST